MQLILLIDGNKVFGRICHAKRFDKFSKRRPNLIFLVVFCVIGMENIFMC